MPHLPPFVTAPTLPPTAPVRTAALLGRLSLVAVASLLATGCSVLQEDRIDFRSAQPGRTLDVPPDLTQLGHDSRFNIPGAVVTASGYQPGQPTPIAGERTAIGAIGDVRIERAGNQRWLVVDRPANELWDPVRNFWQENGFVLTLDQEQLGIMETDWAENRAELPQDFIRRTIGRVFDNLYSTGERDRFRTRFERNAAGGTEIYISHRGMVEVFADEQRNQLVWQPQPTDVELETEFLRRLMLNLGASQAQAEAATDSAAVQAAAFVTTINNLPVLQFADDFDRAWRRVGLALDRTGFTVQDRDRAQGIYFVRFVPAGTTADQRPGFFGRLFGGATPPEAPAQYRVLVRSDGSLATVSVIDGQGQPADPATIQRIVQLLADNLR